MNTISRRYRPTGLKDRMRDEGRMQRWLATRAGISDASMSYVLNEGRTVSEEVAVRIAKALNVPISLIFNSTDAYEMSTLDEREVAVA